MGREKTKGRPRLRPFSLPIILWSFTSRAAVCYTKTTGDESESASEVSLRSRRSLETGLMQVRKNSKVAAPGKVGGRFLKVLSNYYIFL